MKKVYKYGTGETIPEGAVYLNTVTQTKAKGFHHIQGIAWKDCWLVWHYFLVEVEEE